MELFVPNYTDREVYFRQATARDGRLTWRWSEVDKLWFPGKVLAANPPIPPDLAKTLPDRWLNLKTLSFPEKDNWASGPEFRDLINAKATDDDVLAWGFAAKWWLNYARITYEGLPDAQVVLADLPPGYFAHSNNMSLGCLEVISGYPSSEERKNGNVPWRFGKGDGIWLSDDTWPNYFWTLNAQVYAKVAARQTTKLIDIQIALRGASYFLYNYTHGIPGIEKVWT